MTPLDYYDRITDALGAGHDGDTASSYAEGTHPLPCIQPRLLSWCCQSDECTYPALAGRCDHCGHYPKFYVEGDES